MIGRFGDQRTLGRVARCGWIALGFMHASLLVAVALPIVAGDADAGRLASAAALAATVGLFALKAIDVTWLRLGARWQTLVALAAITAIVHHDAVLAGAGVAATPATIAISSVIATRGAMRNGPQWIGAGRRLLAAVLAAARRRGAAATSLPPAAALVGVAVTRRAIPRAPPAGSIADR